MAAVQMRVRGELTGDASPLMMPGNIPLQINGLVPSAHSITTITTLTFELDTGRRKCRRRMLENVKLSAYLRPKSWI